MLQEVVRDLAQQVGCGNGPLEVSGVGQGKIASLFCLSELEAGVL